MTKRWIVFGFEHPSEEAYVIARYRTKTIARLSAYVFRKVKGALLSPDAWVVDGRVVDGR